MRERFPVRLLDPAAERPGRRLAIRLQAPDFPRKPRQFHPQPVQMRVVEFVLGQQRHGTIPVAVQLIERVHELLRTGMILADVPCAIAGCFQVFRVNDVARPQRRLLALRSAPGFAST